MVNVEHGNTKEDAELPARKVTPTTLSLALKATDRASIRAEMFGHWLKENPGTPTLRNTYRYDVDKLPDGAQVYLTRPTRLNKGADFVIHCEKFKEFKNGNPKPPRHADLIEEIAELIAPSRAHATELLGAIQKIWECHPSYTVVSNLKLFKNQSRAVRALILAKWFFIEQDVTYWTESGRHMLRNALEREFGSLTGKP